MTKITPFCILAGALAIAASCTDEVLEKKNNIDKTNGNEVTFTASVSPLKSTRTYYGTPENGKCPIYWSSKDNIVVGSPMGQEGRDTAVYHIVVPTKDGKPVAGGASYAESIELNTQYSQAGVQWGDKSYGSFYSIYPYCAETLRRPDNLPAITRYYNSINLNDKDKNGKDVVTATAKVENVQRIWAPNGTAVDSTTNLLQMYGSNHALVMWAQTDNVKKGDDVNLRFQPLSTCLMMTFECADIENDVNYPATIEKITINAGTDIIAGNMKIEFPSAPNYDAEGYAPEKQSYSESTPTCTLIEGTGSSTIEILPWIRSNEMESGVHPTIQPGEKMQICAFLLPTQGTYDMSNWTISVEVSGNTYSRSMKPSNLEQSSNNSIIKPGEIHLLEFPAFNITNEWNFNPTSWMYDINDNVYLSQITFPGSWEAYCQDNSTTGGGPTHTASQRTAYQNINFKDQLDEGVRAFDIKTRSYGTVVNDKGEITTQPSNVIISGTTGSEYYNGNGTPVSEAIWAIADYIEGYAPTETAVVVLRYEADAEGGDQPIDYQYWMYGLEKALAGLDIVYKGVISSETTIGDVRGKVILKVKLDDEICKYWNENLDTTDPEKPKPYFTYGGTLPALISYAPLTWIADSKVVEPNGKPVENEVNFSFTSLTTILQWKTWTGEWNSKLINGLPKQRPDLFAWNFSCTNNTSTASGNSIINGLPTLGTREEALTSLRKEATSVYNLGYHNEWFLFGCGGTYADSSQSSDKEIPDEDWLNDVNSNILNFTTKMNDWVNTQITSLFTNNTPCPLGIVLFNQVANTQYSGDKILTNLIKMNNAFYLQADQSKPERYPQNENLLDKATGGKSKKKSSGSYESNGWTVN